MSFVKCNAWTEQNLIRLQSLFPDHTLNVNQLFVQACQERPHDKSPIAANMVLEMAVRALAQIHDTENVAVRKHFIRFLEYLDDADTALQRAFQLYQKYPPVPAKNHPPQVILQ